MPRNHARINLSVMPVVNTRAAQERAFWAHRAREEQ